MKDSVLTPKLCRAARVLLDWQQKDLAKAARLSLTAIKAYEQGAEKTRPTTVLALQNALEKNGIEFLSSGGLRATEEITSVARFSGPHYMAKLYEDIYQACATDRSDILTSSVNQKLWWTPDVAKHCLDFIDWVSKEKRKMRSIISKDDATHVVPSASYRAVPAEMLGKVTYTIYADRLAFVLWKKKQVIIIRNPSIVETFRSQFDYLWKMGQAISK